MNTTNKTIQTLRILPKLGFWNVAYMVYYRLSMKVGWRKRKFALSEPITGEFFEGVKSSSFNGEKSHYKKAILNKADEIYSGKFTFFSYHKYDLEPVPNWVYDPFSKETLRNNKKHWTEINEFDLNTGDIKNLWELSRFDWLTDLARGYSVSGNKKYLERLNLLINDWSENNPPNIGVNWKCGQETAIRVMKLFNASVVLGNESEVSLPLIEFVFQHLERIYNNINYAIAQNNNHGTSEAAVLYIGSVWLLNQKNQTSILKERQKKLINYKTKGRDILENRIDKLILKDGTFAQKSINYHRVVIDTMSFVLYGIKIFKEPALKKQTFFKLDKLGNWLLEMVSSDKGEVPNLGSNDGAMFENLHSIDYRDFRPSLQLYFALLKRVSIWDETNINEPLYWRGIAYQKLTSSIKPGLVNQILDHEFIQLTYKDLVVRLKATQDNFRPANDVFHIDVWYKGINVLMDTGSYSYNSELTSYFRSIEAHNTLQFGVNEPMPKISRFLNGAWVKVNGDNQVNETAVLLSWKGGYTDYKDNTHQREVLIHKESLNIKIKDDYTSNVQAQDVKLHYHLPKNWEELINIKCEVNEENEIAPQIKKAYHSLYYKNKAEHVHLTFISTKRKGTFVTTIKFNT